MKGIPSFEKNANNKIENQYPTPYPSLSMSMTSLHARNQRYLALNK